MKTFMARFPRGEQHKLIFDDNADLSALKNFAYAHHAYTGNVRIQRYGIQPRLNTSLMVFAYGEEWAFARRKPESRSSVYDFRTQHFVKPTRDASKVVKKRAVGQSRAVRVYITNASVRVRVDSDALTNLERIQDSLAYQSTSGKVKICNAQHRSGSLVEQLYGPLWRYAQHIADDPHDLRRSAYRQSVSHLNRMMLNDEYK